MSGGIDMASENGVIEGVSVTPVNRRTVAGPVTIAVSWVAIAVGRSVTVRGVPETSPITVAVGRVAVALSRIAVAITVSRVAVAVTVG